QGAVEHRFPGLKAGDPDQKILLNSRIQPLHPKPRHPRRKSERSFAIPERKALGAKDQKSVGLGPKQRPEGRFALPLDERKPPLLCRLARTRDQLGRSFAAGGDGDRHPFRVPNPARRFSRYAELAQEPAAGWLTACGFGPAVWRGTAIGPP